MREAGQNGELGRRPSRTIQTGVLLAAAEHAEERDDVRGADSIGIREDDHRGCLDRRNLPRPVIILLEQISELCAITLAADGGCTPFGAVRRYSGTYA